MSAACFATSAGGYRGRSSVAVPTIAVRVWAARRASQTMASGDGFVEAT
jgi:hypothetical protein